MKQADSNEDHSLTQYLAPFHLWVLVRSVLTSGGQEGLETLWLGTPERAGPAIFVSALDAEIYRLAAHTAGETTWRRCEIEQIDMRQMALILGGELWCQMVFGFCADHTEQLLLSDGLHQLLFVPLHFDIHVKPIHPLTFHFNDWVFDFMREQWDILGVTTYHMHLENINEWDDHILQTHATRAITLAPTNTNLEHGSQWAIFVPQTSRWVFGPRELRHSETMH